MIAFSNCVTCERIEGNLRCSSHTGHTFFDCALVVWFVLCFFGFTISLLFSTFDLKWYSVDRLLNLFYYLGFIEIVMASNRQYSKPEESDCDHELPQGQPGC